MRPRQVPDARQQQRRPRHAPQPLTPAVPCQWKPCHERPFARPRPAGPISTHHSTADPRESQSAHAAWRRRRRGRRQRKLGELPARCGRDVPRSALPARTAAKPKLSAKTPTQCQRGREFAPNGQLASRFAPRTGENGLCASPLSAPRGPEPAPNPPQTRAVHGPNRHKPRTNRPRLLAQPLPLDGGGPPQAGWGRPSRPHLLIPRPVTKPGNPLLDPGAPGEGAPRGRVTVTARTAGRHASAVVCGSMLPRHPTMPERRPCLPTHRGHASLPEAWHPVCGAIACPERSRRACPGEVEGLGTSACLDEADRRRRQPQAKTAAQSKGCLALRPAIQ